MSLGSVWVSVGEFGSLDCHFAIIVELLWVHLKSIFKKDSFHTQILMILYSSGINRGLLWGLFRVTSGV